MGTEPFVLTKDNIALIQRLSEQMPGGFVIYQENKNRDILFVNQMTLSIYGCETMEEFEDHTGNSFSGMVYPDDFEWVQSSIDAQIRGEHGKDDHVEYRVLRKDGAIAWVDDHGFFSHSPDYGDLYYVFLIDITEKHLAVEARNNFYFNASHELLTPLNAVSSYLELAKKHADNQELLTQYLDEAITAKNRMTGIIDDLVQLRRAEMQEKTVAEVTNVHPKKKNGVVLIAEDMETNQMIIKTMVEENGFRSEIADDGVAAVEMVKNHPEGYYGIILMDIRMKTMDGYEATRQIRELPQGKKEILPIIAVSANARDEDRQASRLCGMNGHIAKPYDPELIRTIINAYLE